MGDLPEEDERIVGRDVVRHDRKVVALHWVVIFVYFPLTITALLLLRDWFFDEFNIMGGDLLLGTFDGAVEVHWLFGIALLALGLVHLLMHIGQERKPILPKDLMADIRATVHSVRYVFLLSSWDERGPVHKYKGNQRISYLATFYTIGMAGLTGLMVLGGLMGDVGTWLHVVSGVLVLMLSSFRIAYLLRKREWHAWRSILVTGKMPAWFVKKNHPMWYEELFGVPSGEVADDAADEAAPPGGSDGPGRSGGAGVRSMEIKAEGGETTSEPPPAGERRKPTPEASD